MASNETTADIRQHPTSDEHWLAIITTSRGLCYAATYAGRKPSALEALVDFRTDGGSRSPNWVPFHGSI